MLQVESSPNSHAELTAPTDILLQKLSEAILLVDRKDKGGALSRPWTRNDDVMTKGFWPEIAQQYFVVWRPFKTMPQSALALAAQTYQ